MNSNLILGVMALAALAMAGGTMVFLGEFNDKSPERAAAGSQAYTSSGSKVSFDAKTLFHAVSTSLQPRTVGSDYGRIKDPARTVRQMFYGYRIDHPGMVGDDGDVHLAQSVLNGIPVATPFDRPREIKQLPVSGDCRIRKLQTGEAFGNVQVSTSPVRSGVFAYSNRVLADETRAWVKVLKSGKNIEATKPPGQGRAALQVTVAVTDATAPHYLVLQSGGEPILWDLQTAPGVEIAHVVLIGGRGQGVVLADGNTSVEALQIDADCAPRPSRAPKPHWEMYELPSTTTESGETHEDRALREHAEYDAFFQSTFGRPSETGVAGAWSAANVLIGAAPTTPENRPAYRPMAGRVAHMTPIDHLFNLDPDAAIAAQRQLQRNLALAAIGRDLSALQPDPMERLE